jgi:hypothetical protein
VHFVGLECWIRFSLLQNLSKPAKVYIQPSLQWILIPALREKGPGCAVDYPHPSIAEVKERIEQHLHTSVSSCHVIGWTLVYTDVIGRGHAVTQGVSCLSLTTEDQVLSQTCSCGIWGGQSVTRTDFPEYFVFHLSVSFHVSSTFLQISQTDCYLCNVSFKIRCISLFTLHVVINCYTIWSTETSLHERS